MDFSRAVLGLADIDDPRPAALQFERTYRGSLLMAALTAYWGDQELSDEWFGLAFAIHQREPIDEA